MLLGTEEHLPKDVNSREHRRLTEETAGGMRDVMFWMAVTSIGMVVFIALVAGLKHFY